MFAVLLYAVWHIGGSVWAGMLSLLIIAAVVVELIKLPARRRRRAERRAQFDRKKPERDAQERRLEFAARWGLDWPPSRAFDDD